MEEPISPRPSFWHKHPIMSKVFAGIILLAITALSSRCLDFLYLPSKVQALEIELAKQSTQIQALEASNHSYETQFMMLVSVLETKFKFNLPELLRLAVEKQFPIAKFQNGLRLIDDSPDEAKHFFREELKLNASEMKAVFSKP